MAVLTKLQRTASCPPGTNPPGATVFHFQNQMPFRYAREAIPRYGGYKPTHYSEHVYGGMLHRHAALKPSERPHALTTHEVINLKRNASVPSQSTKPWDRRNIQIPPAGDYKESTIASPRRKEGTTDAKNFAKGNIPGYTGYVPGKVAENMYGETWTRSLYAADKGYRKTHVGSNRLERDDVMPDKSRLIPRGMWDMAQNKNKRHLLTHDGTVIAKMDCDQMKERPIFNPSYQDLVNGWSSCPYTGKHIDPAGRAEPTRKQEGFEQVRPLASDPKRGVFGRKEIFGERKIKANEICHLQQQKNRVNILQT